MKKQESKYEDMDSIVEGLTLKYDKLDNNPQMNYNINLETLSMKKMDERENVSIEDSHT